MDGFNDDPSSLLQTLFGIIVLTHADPNLRKGVALAFSNGST